MATSSSRCRTSGRAARLCRATVICRSRETARSGKTREDGHEDAGASRQDRRRGAARLRVRAGRCAARPGESPSLPSARRRRLHTLRPHGSTQRRRRRQNKQNAFSPRPRPMEQHTGFGRSTRLSADVVRTVPTTRSASARRHPVVPCSAADAAVRRSLRRRQTADLW